MECLAWSYQCEEKVAENEDVGEYFLFIHMSIFSFMHSFISI